MTAMSDQQTTTSSPEMEEKNVPSFRLQKAISDCIKNRSSMETVEKLDLGEIPETYKDDCWLYSIPSHKNDLKRLAEHWIIMSIYQECDPRKVSKKSKRTNQRYVPYGIREY